MRTLFFDPLYIEVLKKYLNLLEQEPYNTLVISDENYIKDVLITHKNTPQTDYTSAIKNPIETIQQATNKVCDAVPLYRTYKWKNQI